MKLTPIRILTVLAMLALSVTMSAQTHNVTGKVTDSSTGEPVIGAGVLLSTGGGTVTDYDGNYVISVPENAVITYSSLGYQSVTREAGNQTVINIELTPDDLLLSEVVGSG